jgi:uncharacterized protein with von Willebrand factor type A (vWA) domain
LQKPLTELNGTVAEAYFEAIVRNSNNMNILVQSFRDAVAHDNQQHQAYKEAYEHERQSNQKLTQANTALSEGYKELNQRLHTIHSFSISLHKDFCEVYEHNGKLQSQNMELKSLRDANREASSVKIVIGALSGAS